jgi:membrane protease YdiL (CAAX protease family)
MTDEIIPIEGVVPDTEPPPQTPRLWGAWATIGLGLAIGLLFLAAQTLAIILLAVVKLASGPVPDVVDYIYGLASNGLAVSLASIASAVVGTAFIVLFVRIRGNKSVAGYIGLRRVSLKTVLLSVLGFVLVFIGISALEILFNTLTGASSSDSVNTSFMTDTYATAGWLPLLWVAVVVFAPVFEEAFFRGFLYVGLERSRIGVAGTIIFTSLVWAALHMQYNLIGMATIVIMGIVLGIIRRTTRSLWPTIIFHSLWNFTALLLTALTLGG